MEIAKTFKARVKEIAKRVDVTVSQKEIGKKLPKRDLKAAAVDLPADLINMIGAINGAHFLWKAIEADGVYGEVRLPSVTHRFQPSGGVVDFGDDDLLWLSLDDAGVYLLKNKNEAPDEADVVYAAPAEEEDYVVIAKSFTDYIKQAIENGFAAYFWLSDDANNTDDVLEFLSKPAKAPEPVRVGVRVRFGSHRGVVRDIVTIKKKAKSGTVSSFVRDVVTWVRVDTDNNQIFWKPFDLVIPLKNDPYERAFADPKTFYAELIEKPAEDAIAGIAPFLSGVRSPRKLKKGPVKEVSLVDGAIVLATTLESLDRAVAVDILVSLVRKLATLDLSYSEETGWNWRPATWKRADEYDPTWYSKKHAWNPAAVVEDLIGALFLVAYRAKIGFDELLVDHDGVLELLREMKPDQYGQGPMAEIVEPFRKEMRGTLVPFWHDREHIKEAKTLGLDPPGDGAWPH